MILTIDQLNDAGACLEQKQEFLRFFPLGQVDVTEELCIEHARLFDWEWAAAKLLTLPALEEYRRVKAPAWTEYQRVKAQAWTEYQRVQDSAWTEYQRVKAQAWARGWNKNEFL